MDISCAQTNGWDIVEGCMWMVFVLAICGLIAYAVANAPKEEKKKP